MHTVTFRASIEGQHAQRKVPVTRTKKLRIDALISWQNEAFKRLLTASPGRLAVPSGHLAAVASAARTFSSPAGSPFSLLNGPYGVP